MKAGRPYKQHEGWKTLVNERQSRLCFQYRRKMFGIRNMVRERKFGGLYLRSSVKLNAQKISLEQNNKVVTSSIDAQ